MIKSSQVENVSDLKRLVEERKDRYERKAFEYYNNCMQHSAQFCIGKFETYTEIEEILEHME